MRNFYNMPYILITLLFLLGSCNEKSINDQSEGITSFPSHPRILLLKGEEETIRSNIKSDLSWQTLHNKIFTECNSILTTAPVERVLIGRRLLDKSREALKRIFYLSYAYRMSGSKTYLDRAEKEMLAISAFTDWNPSHFLDVAEMTMAVAIGYDWLYASLPETTRSTIKDAIIQKGLTPSFNNSYNWFVTSSNNWNQVCNAGMVFGALAIFEDDSTLAKKVISRACESILLPMKEYQPDGAYPEGYGYWGYGTSFNIMFLSAYEKAYGKEFSSPQNTAFLKTAWYLENMSGPSGSCFNYSDCGSGATLNPAMFWIAEWINDPSVLWEEKKFLSKLTSAKDRLLPAILIWSAGLKTSEITEPAARIWTGQGVNPVAMMRTSWSDPNAIYIGLKGGSPKVNHGHMDIGSFVMDWGGIRWAMDFGMQDYNSLEQAGVDLWNMAQTSERWQVFRYNNYAHNTLTVNNQLQKVDGFAPVTSSSGNQAIMNAITDMTAVYAGQLKNANRGLAIVDGGYVTVRDEIETTTNSVTIRWTLVTPASVTIIDGSNAELSKNNKKLLLKVVEPASVTMKTWTTVPSNSFDAQNPGTTMVGFEAVIPANTKTTLQVYLIPEGTTQNPATIPGSLSTWPK